MRVFAQPLSIVRLRLSRSCGAARAVLLVLIAIVSAVQGFTGDAHRFNHLSRSNLALLNEAVALQSGHSLEASPLSDPTKSGHLKADCSHIGCVHLVAFVSNPLTRVFGAQRCNEPIKIASLCWPSPPLPVAFRPPIVA
jgi:hypothetical protein